MIDSAVLRWLRARVVAAAQGADRLLGRERRGVRAEGDQAAVGQQVGERPPEALAPLPRVDGQPRVVGRVAAGVADPGVEAAAAVGPSSARGSGGSIGRGGDLGDRAVRGDPERVEHREELGAVGEVVVEVEADPRLVGRVVAVPVGDQALERLVVGVGEELVAARPHVLGQHVLDARLLELDGEARQLVGVRTAEDRGADLAQELRQRRGLGHRAVGVLATDRRRRQAHAVEPDGPVGLEEVAHGAAVAVEPGDHVLPCRPPTTSTAPS